MVLDGCWKFLMVLDGGLDGFRCFYTWLLSGFTQMFEACFGDLDSV